MLSTVHESSTDKEDDEDSFPLPPQFTSKFHPEDNTETTMVTFTSIQKSMLFSKATANLVIIVKKIAHN